jgi:hypothetical protein
MRKGPLLAEHPEFPVARPESVSRIIPVVGWSLGIAGLKSNESLWNSCSRNDAPLETIGFFTEHPTLAKDKSNGQSRAYLGFSHIILPWRNVAALLVLLYTVRQGKVPHRVYRVCQLNSFIRARFMAHQLRTSSSGLLPLPDHQKIPMSKTRGHSIGGSSSGGIRMP